MRTMMRVNGPISPPSSDLAWNPELLLPAGREENGGNLRAWDELLSRGAPLTVEIGTGNGIYLESQARARPEMNFLGIERCAEFFGKLKRRLVRNGLTNVGCVRADARDVLDQAIPPAAVDLVICNFSDPWPKRRHRSRRVFRPDFVDRLGRILKPGGEIVFKTDVGWYFNLTIAEFRRRPAWRILDAGPVERSESDAGENMTNFERKARETGSRVWAFRAAWMGVPAVPGDGREARERG